MWFPAVRLVATFSDMALGSAAVLAAAGAVLGAGTLISGLRSNVNKLLEAAAFVCLGLSANLAFWPEFSDRRAHFQWIFVLGFVLPLALVVAASVCGRDGEDSGKEECKKDRQAGS